jgi:hypothetical protein
MLVYMLLNEVEERCYVGSTEKTVIARLAEHWALARGGARSPLHEAMNRWPHDEYWTYVVLQNCYSLEELSEAEERWISHCHSADTGVGYNVHRTVHGGSRKQPQMTEQRREFFRECGRRGGSAGRVVSPKTLARRERQARLAVMTDEERTEFFRECGRRGAVKSKSLSR